MIESDMQSLANNNSNSNRYYNDIRSDRIGMYCKVHYVQPHSTNCVGVISLKLKEVGQLFKIDIQARIAQFC